MSATNDKLLEFVCDFVAEVLTRLTLTTSVTGCDDLLPAYLQNIKI